MTERRPPYLLVGFALLVIAAGLVATWGRYGPSNIPSGVPALLAGWAIAGSGLVAWARVPASRVGPLLAAAGLATFLTDFSSCLSIVPISPRCLQTGALSPLARQLQFVWTGFFAHALIAYPSGRAVTRLDRGAIFVAYVTAVLPFLWQADAVPLLLPVLLAVITAAGWAAVDRRAQAARRPTVLATCGMALAMAAIYLVALALPRAGSGGLSEALSGSLGVADPMSVLELLAAIAALWSSAGLLATSRDRSMMADLVIDLGDANHGGVSDALARALGDSTLQVGFQSDAAGGFVDDAGRPLEVPPMGSTTRTVVTLQRDGRPVAVLIHDPVVASDPALRNALAAATRLTEANAALQGEARDQLDEVLSSRRRLLDAGVAERRELEQRLHDGPERHLDLLTTELIGARTTVDSPGVITSRLDRAIEQLAETRIEVRELARGLHPRVLEERGLRGALTELADRAPVPVELAMDMDGDPDTGIGATIYFLTSEALANVAKYASVSSVRVTLERSGDGIRLVITDDGPGGADPTAGSGLRGLADRVEALGGSFEIDSRPGQGTRLAATIPSGGEAHG